MMRSTIGPGCLQKILFSEQQTGCLWSANAFPAAISNGCCAALEMYVREREDFGGRVNDNRNVVLFGNLRNRLRA